MLLGAGTMCYAELTDRPRLQHRSWIYLVTLSAVAYLWSWGMVNVGCSPPPGRKVPHGRTFTDEMFEYYTNEQHVYYEDDGR